MEKNILKKEYKIIAHIFGENRIKINEPLSGHSTINIGGPADVYLETLNINEFIKIIRALKEYNIPFIIIGGGSNILFSDNGFRGVVIKNKANKIKIVAIKGNICSEKKDIKRILVEVESGCMVNQLVRFTIEESISGLEYFLGLPGTIGGAIYMNAHNMHKKEFIGDNLFSAQILNDQGDLLSVTNDYFKFGYDQSIIQKTHDIVISAVFELKGGCKDDLWKIASEEISYRNKTHPIKPSLGCTFKNISKSQAMQLATPNYTTSAGYLIDRCNLKGVNIGNAQISDKHANFIINNGGAKASDVIQLIKDCKRKVKEKFNINLCEEIKFIGDFNG